MKATPALNRACIGLLLPLLAWVGTAFCQILPHKETVYAPPPLSGLYVMGGKGGLERARSRLALSNRYVDGIYLRFDWRDIEPRAGQYAWDVIDRQLALVQQARKKASVSIRAGAYSPDWLRRLGAEFIHTKVAPERQKDFCEDLNVPVPWDATFLAQWVEFIKAFGQRYHTHPAISSIKITGISYRTSETSLPHKQGETKRSVREGKVCQFTDDIKSWKEKGYSTTKVTNAYKTILGVFATAFPHHPLVLMSGSSAFPPLGANGENDPRAAALATTEFLTIGRQQLGNRFVGQNNGLTSLKVDSGVKRFAESGGRVGYQAAWHVTNDAHCYMGGGAALKKAGKSCPESPDTMRAVFMQAIGAKAEYVEIMAIDIANPRFEQALAEAHRVFVTKIVKLQNTSSPPNIHARPAR